MTTSTIATMGQVLVVVLVTEWVVYSVVLVQAMVSKTMALGMAMVMTLISLPLSPLRSMALVMSFPSLVMPIMHPTIMQQPQQPIRC